MNLHTDKTVHKFNVFFYSKTVGRYITFSIFKSECGLTLVILFFLGKMSYFASDAKSVDASMMKGQTCDMSVST